MSLHRPVVSRARGHIGRIAPVSAMLFTLAVLCTLVNAQQPVGYDDTPQIPGQRWRVHDGDRPLPRVVASGSSFSEGAAAPADAVVLFDGSDLSRWQGSDVERGWKVADGYMEVVRGAGTLRTRDEFGDFQLHLEWAAPAEVKSNSQGRGNSGVFLHGVYEIQVLDSFENRTYSDGQAGALYGQTPPLVNASRAPGEWQTYDIIFEAPRWIGEQLKSPAYVTVFHNGVLIHHRREYLGPTRHKTLPRYSEPTPARGPITLQDHGDPVRYRNIWIRELGTYDESG